MEGTLIGQYRVAHKIGAGGMGVVYLAQHTLVGRWAAIKVLLPEFSARRAMVMRFFNEARAMTSIPDPGIVQMYDFGFHTDGAAYIVMELLDGETVERRLKRLVRLELVDAVRITRQIAGSLASAHAVGIIHRDLKPDNVFIVRDPEALGGERPKVLDFGIAKLSGSVDGSQTLADMMMGTPAYMSPEQCCGAGEVDARSDIYSLGCVLARLVTGRLPFDGRGVGELLSAHLSEPPRLPSELAPELPREIDDIVVRCLAKSPDDRFQTMLELQAACDALLARLTGTDVPAMTAPAVPATASARAALREPSMSPPTTLSSAIGITDPSAPVRTRRRIAVWLGVVGGAAAIGVIAAIAFTGGEELAAPTPAAVLAAPVAPASPPVPAAAAAEPPSPVDAGVASAADVVDAAVAETGGGASPAAAPPSPAARPKKPRPHRSAAEPDSRDLYDER